MAEEPVKKKVSKRHTRKVVSEGHPLNPPLGRHKPMSMVKPPPEGVPSALDALGGTPDPEMEQDPEVEQEPEEPEDQDPEETENPALQGPAFAHPSKHRCTANDMRYPHYMKKKCGALMVPNGQDKDGRVKYWKCPRCKDTGKTVGEKI